MGSETPEQELLRRVNEAIGRLDLPHVPGVDNERAGRAIAAAIRRDHAASERQGLAEGPQDRTEGPVPEGQAPKASSVLTEEELNEIRERWTERERREAVLLSGDLDESRVEDAVHDVNSAIGRCAADVPRLLAEVERLRRARDVHRPQ